MAVKPKALDAVKEDLQKLQLKVEKITLKTPSTAPSSSAPKKLDLVSDETNDWLANKLAASYEDPKFRSKVRSLVSEKLDSFTISVSNFSESTKKSVGKWGQSAVVDDLYDIVKANADLVVLALGDELKKEAKKNPLPADLHKGIEQSLNLLNKGIKANKDEIEKILTSNWQKEVENMMSVATVKAMFSDFNEAASKVLETLKLWSHLQPLKEKEISAAAQNLLDFQQSKGKN